MSLAIPPYPTPLLCPAVVAGHRVVDRLEPAPVTNPDLAGPRPFWKFLEHENATRPGLAVLRGRLDLYA